MFQAENGLTEETVGLSLNLHTVNRMYVCMKLVIILLFVSVELSIHGAILFYRA